MKKIVKIVVLVLLSVAVLFTFYLLYKKSQPKEVIYKIERVSIGTVENRTVATGRVEPRNEILVKPQISGIVAEIYKSAGDKVNKGDVIAKIKVVPEMVNLNSAEARVQRATLALEQTKKEFERNKELFAKAVISKEEYEKSQLQYNNDKLELQSAQDNFSLVKDGITSSTANYSNTLVRSTITGMILDIPVKVGNSVIPSNNFNDGTTIATVADMNDMIFVGKLDETEVGRVHSGMDMNISIGALQDEKLTAKLEYISPKGVEESGAVMFEMKAAVQVPATIFVRAGYSANAEILLQQSANVLTLPEGCVEFKNDSTFVQLLQKEHPQQFTKRVVELGLSDGINVEITKGLKDGDKVRGALQNKE